MRNPNPSMPRLQRLLQKQLQSKKPQRLGPRSKKALPHK